MTRVVIAKKVLSDTYDGAPWDFSNANGLSIYLPLGEKDCRPTGASSPDADHLAEAPCVPFATSVVGNPIIEPQLKYYTQASQIRFTADVPAWGNLLNSLGTSVDIPVRTAGFRQVIPLAPPSRLFLPLVAKP